MANIFDLTPEELALDLAYFIGQDIVQSVTELSNEYMITHDGTGVSINLALNSGTETTSGGFIDTYIPPFDMRDESAYIPSLGRRIGNLLQGPATKISKTGNRYNIIPLPNGDFRTVSDGRGLDQWHFKGKTYSTYAPSSLDAATTSLERFLSGGR